MRIRKNGKLLTILQSTAPEWRIETQMCQLNQSPWDVINFSNETYRAPSFNQLGDNDIFAVNKSMGDSAGVVERVELMMDCEDDKGMEMETKDDNGGEEEEEEPTKSKKKKRNSCKGLNTKTSVSAKRGPVVDSRTRLKKGNSSNPCDFDYYSGFGPSRGKRRANRNNGGGGGEEEAKIKTKSSSKSKDMEGLITQNTTPPPSSPSLIDGSKELDFVEEEEEDDDYEQRSSNGGKKRVRKLVKARSLKSLM